MGMALHAAPMHDAVERVEGSKQGGGAVPLIVVRHCSAFAGLERQPRLGAIKRLDLRLLIDREHHRMGRWMHVEADDILHLLGQCRVGGAFEGAQAMRCSRLARQMRCTVCSAKLC
jgi:hypothetical protein